jgi:hypothetical protein
MSSMTGVISRDGGLERCPRTLELGVVEDEGDGGHA